MHAHLARDALDAVASGASATYFVPAGTSSGSFEDKLLLSLALRRHPRSGCRSRWIGVYISDNDVFHVASAAAQDLVHRRASMGAEMETIRHLDRVRRALAAALGGCTSTIADGDLNAGMCAQPIGEDLGGAVVKQVDWLVCFQIEQQRFVPALLRSQGDIDTQHSRTELFPVVGHGMQQVQQRIGADEHADFARQASATLAASL